MLDWSRIFFCSGFSESSFKMSDIGLDLFKLSGFGSLDRLCRAAAVTALLGEVGSLGSGLFIPGNLGKG